MGLPLANVQTTDTFQTWLTRTNEIIVSTPNTQYVAANTYVNDQISQLSGLLTSNVSSLNTEISQLSSLLSSNVSTINTSISQLSGLLASNVSTINTSINQLSGLLTSNVATLNTNITANVNSLLASRAANTYVNALLANTNAYIATKLDIAGGSITNSLTVQQNLTVDGNFTVNGNTTVINVENFRVQDSIIYLAGNNYTADTLDIGFIANYNDGTWANQHTGLIRDSGTKEYYLFSKYELELEGNNNVDITHPSFRLGNLNLADISANAISGNGALVTSLNASEITSGTLSATRLPNSGVTANTYGSASKVPVITVTAKGIVSEITETNVAGVTNFTYTDANATFTISTADGGSFKATIADSGVTANTYGSASKVPVITVDSTGFVTEITETNVAGVTNFTYTGANTTFTISTADGGSFTANIADDSIALGTKTTGNYVATVSNTDSNILVTGSGSETAAVSIGLANNVTVGGIITALDFNSTSDARLKENIVPIENPLDKVLQLAGVEFDWKTSGEHSMGVIAQQVEQIVPELVHTNESGFKTVSYGKITGLLIEAIKELKTIVDSK